MHFRENIFELMYKISDILFYTVPRNRDIDCGNISSKASFIAAGDNLIHGPIYRQAKLRAKGNGYDFDLAYKNTAGYFKNFDIKFINQETLVTDSFTPATYPRFSSPSALGDKVVDMGFNVVCHSNNHVYDLGSEGVGATVEYWDTKDVLNVGFYTGNDDTDIKYLTINNIKIAFLAYTRGTNGLTVNEDTVHKIVDLQDYAVVNRHIRTAKKNADIVIVSCHWGKEDTNKTTIYQKIRARFLNFMGADVIIGTHPHVIQPVEQIKNKINKNKTLVYYSLGNFISAQRKCNNMVGGLACFDIVKNTDGTVSVENPYFVPTVTHYDEKYRNIRNYIFKDYTPELAEKHYLTKTKPDFSYEYMKNIIKTVIPKEYLSDK